MTMTKKTLPAILLAAILAAALLLGLGLLGQPAFAAAASDYTIIIGTTANDTNQAVPGQTLSLDHTVIYDGDYNDVTGSALVTDARWTILEGSEYASIAADPNDPLAAEVTFGALPEGEEQQTIKVLLTLTIGGKAYQSYEGDLYLERDYYDLQASLVDSHLLTGDTQDVHVEMRHYTEADPEGIPVEDTAYSWTYDQNQVEISPQTAYGSTADFTLTRKSEDDAAFYITASYRMEDGMTAEDGALFFFDEISTDLSGFEVDLTNAGLINYVEDSSKTITPQVQVRFGDWVIPDSQYDLIIQKYEGYSEETGEEIWTEYSEQALKVDPQGTVNQSGEQTGGLGTYKIMAKAKAGGRYTGMTSEDPAFVYLIDRHTMNGLMNAISRMDGELFLADTHPYLQYNVTPGTTLTPVVTLASDGGTLVQGKDYEITYQNLDTQESLASFPVEYGAYAAIVKGIGDYYGEHWNFNVRVGEKNNFTAKAKKVIKVKKGKKKTVAAKKAFTVKKNKGKVRYYKVAVNGKYSGKVFDKITVSNAGKVTVKKGLKKGTYKVRVTIVDPGTTKYQPADKTMNLTVKVR